MESSDDSGKVGHVSISVRQEETQATPAAANPQLKFYFWILYTLAQMFMFLLLILVLTANVENNWQSTIKTRAGFFIIMVIVSLSVTILATAILIIFTSHCLQSLIRDIHYNIFKCIGYFSATIACFCVIVVIFVPLDLNPWIAYPVICILFTATLFAYYLLWKHVGARQPEDDHFPIILPAASSLVVPLFLAFCAFISPGLHWIKYMVLCLDLTILVTFCFIIAYMTHFYGRKQHDGTSSNDPTRPLIILRDYFSYLILCDLYT